MLEVSAHPEGWKLQHDSWGDWVQIVRWNGEVVLRQEPKEQPVIPFPKTTRRPRRS